MELMQIFKAFRTFFFKPQPVHNTAILRILFGILLLYNWNFIWNHLDLFWTSDGFLTLQTAQDNVSRFRLSLFDYLPDEPRAAILIAVLNLVGSIGVLFGFFTRTSLVIAFMTLLSFHSRNVLILNGADSIMRNLLFFLMFTPCGDAYSLDRLWKKWKGTAPATPVKKAPWGLRLFQIQFCVIYVSTVLFKLKGSHWIDGTAVYYATRLDDFVRMPIPLFNSILVIKLATWGTLVVELAMGLLVWAKELRYWVLLAGIGLHLGIEVAMNIPLFEWVMIFAMMAMVPPVDVMRVQGWILRKFKVSRSLGRVSSLDAAGVR